MRDPKKAAQRRGITKAGRRSTSAKAARSPTAAKPARGRALPHRKAAPTRSAGELDSALATRLETVAQGLGQIAELRAEVEGLRALIEKLVQTVSALIP